MIHVVQNAGIVQVLYNTPGSKDSAEFKHIAPLYTVFIFTSPELDFCVPKFVCVRHVLKVILFVYFHQRGDSATSMAHTDRSQANMSQCVLHGIIALQNIPQKRDRERER